MKVYKLILNFIGLFLLTSCVVNSPVEPSIEPSIIEPSIIEPTAPEIDETKLVGVVVNELLPVVNIDCEEEIQSNFEYKKVVGGEKRGLRCKDKMKSYQHMTHFIVKTTELPVCYP